ncbi:MAG: hypothetical protein U1E89_06140 [Burkholderiaceae bacterium]
MSDFQRVAPIPAPARAPRGAEWAARAALYLGRQAAALWQRAGAEPGRSGRSADELLSLARAVQIEQPALANELRSIALHAAARVAMSPSLALGGGVR